MKTIAILNTVAFAGLAILHFYRTLGGKLDIRKMIPVANSKPVFTPGVLGTFVVATALAYFAAISLALGFSGAVSVDYQPYVKFAGYAIGAVLVLRAIGEFKYVGFSNVCVAAISQHMTAWLTLLSACWLVVHSYFWPQTRHNLWLVIEPLEIAVPQPTVR